MRKTIVITGASDGIGAAAARRLHREGHEVVVVGRSADKTRAVADELGVDWLLADFRRLQEVRALAEVLGERYPRIDVLANNAGGLLGPRRVTEDGFEATFGVNHLAPFLLTNLLMPTLLASRATVVTTSSAAARFGGLDLADLNHERSYGANGAYADAKLANVVFTRGLHLRHGHEGLSAAAFHPGLVATNFATANRGPAWLAYRTPLRRLFMVSPERGADTLVWLATTTAGQSWEPGQYYEGRRLAVTNPQAYDDTLASRFWDISAEMVGLA